MMKKIFSLKTLVGWVVGIIAVFCITSIVFNAVDVFIDNRISSMLFNGAVEEIKKKQLLHQRIMLN